MEFQAAQAPERVAQTVHGAEAFDEGQRAFERGHHHVPARLSVGPVADGALQRAHVRGIPKCNDTYSR